MATTPQPAKKSYFFDKGYKDLGNTIKGAWARNSDSIKKYASIQEIWEITDSLQNCFQVQ